MLHRSGKLGQLLAQHTKLPFLRDADPGQQTQQGALAAATGSLDKDPFTALNLELVQCQHNWRIGVPAKAELPDLYDRILFGGSVCCCGDHDLNFSTGFYGLSTALP